MHELIGLSRLFVWSKNCLTMHALELPMSIDVISTVLHSDVPFLYRLHLTSRRISSTKLMFRIASRVHRLTTA